VAYDISAQMIYGRRSLDEAVTEIIRVRLKPQTGGLIAISKNGEIAMQHNTPGMSCAAADSRGRFEMKLVVE
jgi:beta-aspartyl-peptidase (threonine type)